MLDRDLTELYAVETCVLKQAVRRNIDRFPPDFMFEMDNNELDTWRSQIVISKEDRQGLRHPPFCFTEQGVAMLSSVLKSKQAIQVNIQVMRVFTRMRQLLTDNTDLRLQIAEIQQQVTQVAKKQDGNDKSIALLFEYIDRLQETANSASGEERKQIGYKVGKA